MGCPHLLKASMQAQFGAVVYTHFCPHLRLDVVCFRMPPRGLSRRCPVSVVKQAGGDSRVPDTTLRNTPVSVQPADSRPMQQQGLQGSTFQSVLGSGIWAQLVGHCGEQPVRRWHGHGPGVEQHEAAGAVGVLGLLGAAALPQHRRHLIPQAPCHGHARQRSRRHLPAASHIQRCWTEHIAKPQSSRLGRRWLIWRQVTTARAKLLLRSWRSTAVAAFTCHTIIVIFVNSQFHVQRQGCCNVLMIACVLHDISTSRIVK